MSYAFSAQPSLMSDTSTTVKTPPAARPKTKLKGIAFPTEHGAWGMVFEPLVAALAVTFSVAGLAVAVAFLGAFLMRQPLKVLMAERAAGRRMPQGVPARRYLAIYGLIFLAGAIAALLTTSFYNFWPLIIAAPLAMIQTYYDSARQSRKLAPELAGAVAISSSAAVIALTGGWTAAQALVLWLIMVARAVPSIFYVRERLLLEKGKPFAYYAPVLLSAAAVAAVALAAYLAHAPWLAAAVMAVLLVRAALGLSRFSKRRKAMQIGVFEVVFGAMTVLAIILGYRLGI
jgi:hypothetical protein